mgnify:CR=1 FL=1
MSLRVQTAQLKLLIRADASAQIGTGHIMRCLALAQAWQAEGGAVTFLMGTSAPGLESRLQSEGFEVMHHEETLGSLEDGDRTITLAEEMGARCILVDGYHFGSDYQKQLKKGELRVLFIDDNGHVEHHYADWVLNQNIYAHEEMYESREPETQLLLGTRYVLLRKEFWPWRNWQRQIFPEAHKVLVTLGGGDPDNVTLSIIQALKKMPIDTLEVIVVVGATNPHYEYLQQAAQSSNQKIELRQNITDMPELMAWADIAITAGGSTCWELAFMDLPSLVIAIADNQLGIVRHLVQLGIVEAIDQRQLRSEMILRDTITNFLQRLQDRAEQSIPRLVDGYGAARVVRRLQQEPIQLRNVCPEDCQLLWHWANDAIVRASSFSEAPIPLADHEQWFANKLRDPQCHIFIALDSDAKPIGQIRFDFINERQAEVDVSLDNQSRGKGFGHQLIELSTQKIFRITSANAVYASIKKTNIASIKSFQRAGFFETNSAEESSDLTVLYSKIR